MKQELIIIILLISLTFIQAENYPAPFVNGKPVEMPNCEDNLEPYYDNNKGKWLCPAKVIEKKYSNPMDAPSICIEQTCPGGDQSKCYCSMYSKGSGELIQAGNIQTNLESKINSNKASFQVYNNSGAIYFDKEEKSDEELQCKRVLGCWDEEFLQCREIGYRKNGTYCYNLKLLSENTLWNMGTFINQTKNGEECNESYECESELCLEGICLDKLEEINRQVDKKLERLKQEINSELEEKLENISQTKNKSLENVNKINSNISIIKRVLNWMKNIF